ncbi:MAG: nucleotidyltransferase family protein [Alphaproteobacteria bacterium]|nr:nucleotidyltransferase family protein [Alphaproteobacteria bacterium]
MIPLPTIAMVLAAGIGLRMRPLAHDRPKAMIAIGGRTLIDRALDRLVDAGIETAVVNVHYKAELLRRHLAARVRPRIVVSDETDALLDTGGGIAKALPLLGGGPFFAVNSDMIWFNGARDLFERMAERFDPAVMDALLLVHPTPSAVGYDGPGDFTMAPDGQIERRVEARVAPFVFTGIQLLHPRLFDAAPAGAFSLNRLYDRALGAGRLFGLRHDGLWIEVGTPGNALMAERVVATL